MLTGLSLQFGQMQGDFPEMQGGPNRSPGKNPHFSIVYKRPSLLNKQGDAITGQGTRSERRIAYQRIVGQSQEVTNWPIGNV